MILPKYSHLRHIRRTLISKTGVRILKGVLAYQLAMLLFFLPGFRNMLDYPITLNGTFLIAVAGFPGKAYGEMLAACTLAIVGAHVGAILFVIEAKLDHAPVAQGIVLCVFLYIMAWVKAGGLQYFGFSLLAILVGFNGIYTSYLVGGFHPDYLESYLEAYLLGMAIVLFINFVIWPMSVERELRTMLVASLERSATFADLIIKTFTLQISEEEKEARNRLHGSIRADFDELDQKLQDIAFEINWSKYKLSDYVAWVAQTKHIQESLIAMSSGTAPLDKSSGEVDLFRRIYIDGAKDNILKLRRAMNRILADITRDVAVDHTSPLQDGWENYVDEDEDQEDMPEPSTQGEPNEEVERRLQRVATNLQREFDVDDSRRQSTEQLKQDDAKTQIHNDEKNTGPLCQRVLDLRDSWSVFKDDQNERLYQGLLADSGQVRDINALLFSEMPQASRKELFLAEMARKVHSEVAPDPVDPYFAHTVIRVKSFLFGFELLTVQLIELHNMISVARRQKAKLRLHLSQPMFTKKDSKETLTKSEALALLGEGKSKEQPQISAWHRFWVKAKRIETFFLSERSLYAFKTMIASEWLLAPQYHANLVRALVFGVLLLAPSSRNFFNTYGLNSGLITIVVAMSPSLGQSLFTFMLQIFGTAFGAVFGIISLEIFKNCGGFYYNPYGCVCLSFLLSIPACYLVYTKPMYFSGCLLALNSLGVITVTEIVNQANPNWDSPAFRGGKLLACTAIALGLAFIFQLVLLRRPARRVFRLQLAQVYKELLLYYTIFTKLTSVVTPALKPTGSQPEISQAAIDRVIQDLRKREARIQQSIIQLFPLMKFSQVEPNLVKPFNAKASSALVRHAQFILDRFKEARYSVGNTGFSETIRADFMEPLYPYRRMSQRGTIVQFYLVANSLQTKTPLPKELPFDNLPIMTSDLHRDTLVLSSRLARTEDGRELLRSDTFGRYWFYLSAVVGVTFNLQLVANSVKDWLGDLQDELGL